MKKLMIDMDDVICDGGFLTLVNQFLNTNYKIEDVKAYYIQDLIPKERMSEWARFFQGKNIYDYVKLLDGAYEVMENLQKNYEKKQIVDFSDCRSSGFAGGPVLWASARHRAHLLAAGRGGGLQPEVRPLADFRAQPPFGASLLPASENRPARKQLSALLSLL